MPIKTINARSRRWPVIKTLLSGDVLRVNACSHDTVSLLFEYCSRVGHTLLQHVEVDDDITLYIEKH